MPISKNTVVGCGCFIKYCAKITIYHHIIWKIHFHLVTLQHKTKSILYYGKEKPTYDQ